MTINSTHTAAKTGAKTATVTQFLRRWRKPLFFIGLFALMLSGLIGLAAATGWEETKAQLAKISFAQILILLVFSSVNYILRGLRWHLFSTRIDLHTTLLQDLRLFIGGFAMSITPGRIGELIRMRWIHNETGARIETIVPLVLMDRALDLAALAVLLGISITLSASGIFGAYPIAVLALGIAVVATRPVFLAAIVTALYKTTGLWPRAFARVRMAARSVSRFCTAPLMLTALGFGLIGWMAEGLSFYLLLNWLGADVDLWTAVAIFVFSTLAGGLSGAPGGVGGAEAAMVGLLVLQGVPMEMAIPATAIIRITTLWYAIGLGFILFPINERISTRGTHALEKR